MNCAPIFQEPAVCLTKYGPESGETASAILARKEWERKSGKGSHANEFWWGIGEKGGAETIRNLIAQYKARSIIFVPIQNQTKVGATPPEVLVWRKYQTLGGGQNIDIPQNILVTSSVSTKDGKSKSNHCALVCNSRDPIRPSIVARFANSHYKNLTRAGLGSNQRGQRTTSSLVKYTSHAITAAECDAEIRFSASFAVPYCVELHDGKRVPYSRILALNGITTTDQWLSAVAAIRR